MIKLDKKSYFNFSGGEVHLKANLLEARSNSNNLTILMQDYSMDGLMALAEYCEIAYRCKIKIHVIYPYFPYARQDRVIQTNEPFSLRIFCKFLNSLSLASVTIVDPHSDVVSALVHDVRIIPQYEVAKEAIPRSFFATHSHESFNSVFVSPDAGAYKKVAALMPDDNRIAVGVKERDSSGNIIKTKVYSPLDLTGKTCIMVDDICDGGRTFIELTKALKDQGASKVYLYVTHGIFSKGLLPLKDAGIEHVYTTDSFTQEVDNFLTVKETIYV